MNRRQRGGFSLIELVIVILIMGIIAAVAAPRMFDTAASAEQATTRQQLAVLRNAIEMVRAREGAYPANNELPGKLEVMLTGPFPSPGFGTAKGKTGVFYDASTDDTTPAAVSVAADAGWAYKPANGQLRLNVADGELGSDW